MTTQQHRISSNVNNASLCVSEQDEVVVKVDSTKEVLKMGRWVLAAASEKSTAARAGMTGKSIRTHTLPEGLINDVFIAHSVLREVVTL